MRCLQLKIIIIGIYQKFERFVVFMMCVLCSSACVYGEGIFDLAFIAAEIF
jgi:hypothetical protein